MPSTPIEMLETPPSPLAAWRADGTWRPLAPAWVTVARLGGLVRTGILAGVALPLLVIAVAAIDGFKIFDALMVFVMLFLFLLAPALLWPSLAYRHRAYLFSEQGLQLRRGVLWRSQIAVPRSRIQHTDVSQGPIERAFGLASLTVHTAGNHYAAVSLPGLEYGEALAVRDFLLAGGAAEGGDAV